MEVELLGNYRPEPFKEIAALITPVPSSPLPPSVGCESGDCTGPLLLLYTIMYTIEQYTIEQYTTVQYTTVQYTTVQYIPVHNSSMKPFCTLQCDVDAGTTGKHTRLPALLTWKTGFTKGMPTGHVWLRGLRCCACAVREVKPPVKKDPDKKPSRHGMTDC